MTSAIPMRDTRARIIGAAMELFWSKGYGSTSIADILGRAEINSGSLYHFFPGKRDLLVAVLEEYRDGIGPMLLDPVWEGIDDPIARIFALLAKYRELIVMTDCLYGCPIGSLALELHEPDPIVRQRMVENFDAWTGAIRACLEAAEDSFPADSDFQSLAEFTLTVMEGAVMQARTYRDVAYFDRAIAQIRLFYDSLMQGRKE
jgi:TetR/AcrR family transcriptional repressor of nem operon